jgi:hypothetical protein
MHGGSRIGNLVSRPTTSKDILKLTSLEMPHTVDIQICRGQVMLNSLTPSRTN